MRSKNGVYLGSMKPLRPCKPSSGYMLRKWANQHGRGVKWLFTSSSLHGRINRRAGLAVYDPTQEQR